MYDLLITDTCEYCSCSVTLPCIGLNWTCSWYGTMCI